MNTGTFSDSSLIFWLTAIFSQLSFPIFTGGVSPVNPVAELRSGYGIGIKPEGHPGKNILARGADPSNGWNT